VKGVEGSQDRLPVPVADVHRECGRERDLGRRWRPSPGSAPVALARAVVLPSLAPEDAEKDALLPSLATGTGTAGGRASGLLSFNATRRPRVALRVHELETEAASPPLPAQ